MRTSRSPNLSRQGNALLGISLPTSSESNKGQWVVGLRFFRLRLRGGSQFPRAGHAQKRQSHETREKNNEKPLAGLARAECHDEHSLVKSITLVKGGES